MKSCLFLFNSMSPFSRKKVYGGETLTVTVSPVALSDIIHPYDNRLSILGKIKNLLK